MIKTFLSQKKIELLWILAGRFAIGVVSLLSIHFMTQYLDYKEYSKWALLASLQNFSALFLINPFDQYLYRHTHKWLDQGQLGFYFSEFKKYLFLISSFFAILFFIYLQIKAIDSSFFCANNFFVPVIFGTWIFFSALVLTLMTLLNLIGRRINGSFCIILASIAGLGFSILLVNLYQQGIFWIIGQVIGAFIGTIYASAHLKKVTGDNNINFSNLNKLQFVSKRNFKKFCLPLSIATGFMWLQNSGYRFFVEYGWGEEKFALLVLGLVLANQLSAMIESLAIQFLYPYFTRHISNASTENEISIALTDIFIILAPIYCVWTGFAVIFAPLFLNSIADVKYHEGAIFVIAGLGIEFFRCMTNLWSNTSRAIQDNKNLIFPYMAGSFFLIVIIIFMQIYEIEIFYVSIAMIISSALTYTLMFFFMQKLIKIKCITKSFIICFFFMIICFSLSLYLNFSPYNFAYNYYDLLPAIPILLAILYFLLYKNLSFKRLLNVNLSKTF